MDPTQFKQVRRLMRAAHQNKPASIQRLLREGVDVELADEDGFTAMHRAALVGASDVMRLLLQVGARPAPLTKDGWPPLFAALHQGHREAVVMLLDAGTDLQTFGCEALFRAYRRGHPALVELLLERGADPNATDEFGNSILSRAIGDAKSELVARLLAAGADPNRRHRDGWTPLFDAAAAGNMEIIDVLAEHGASIEVVDDLSRSAHTIARLGGHELAAARLAILGAAVQVEFEWEVREQSERRAAAEAVRLTTTCAFGGRPGRITAGAFAKFVGHAVPTPEGKLRVLVQLFGRATEVTVDADHFEFADTSA